MLYSTTSSVIAADIVVRDQKHGLVPLGPGPKRLVNIFQQSLAFRKPVHLGDTVTAEVEVSRVGRAGRLLDFATRCTNQRQELVLSGDARVLMPEERHNS